MQYALCIFLILKRSRFDFFWLCLLFDALLVLILLSCNVSITSAINREGFFVFKGTRELSSFGDVGRRDSCLFSNIMGLNGSLNVVLTS